MMSTQTEDSNTIEENDIDYVVDVITKEVPKDERLVVVLTHTGYTSDYPHRLHFAA
jgi:hypothetical protein